MHRKVSGTEAKRMVRVSVGSVSSSDKLEEDRKQRKRKGSDWMEDKMQNERKERTKEGSLEREEISLMTPGPVPFLVNVWVDWDGTAVTPKLWILVCEMR